MKISILIPMHNESAKIRKTLKYLSLQDYPKKDIQYVIVDDNSTDDSVKVVKSFGINPIIVDKQGWASSARNLGLKHCGGDVVLFLDAHVYLKNKNSLRLISDIMCQDQSIGGVCGRYTSAESNDWNLVRDIRRDAIFEKTQRRVISLDEFTTLSMAISVVRRELLEEVQFPEGFVGSFGEDTAFQLTAHHHKWNFIFVPELFGIHDSPQSASSILRKILFELRGTANVLIYCGENQMKVPYLHFFLSYPMGRIFSVFLMFISWRIGFGMFVVCQFLELSKIKKFFMTQHSFVMQLRAAVYSWMKELVSGLYVPWYIIGRTYNKPALLGGIFAEVLGWEREKIVGYYSKVKLGIFDKNSRREV